MAAALLTFNELHILLSRSAPTDVAFSLSLLIAVALLAEALERGGMTWAIAGCHKRAARRYRAKPSNDFDLTLYRLSPAPAR